jgi:hypothetical protein
MQREDDASIDDRPQVDRRLRVSDDDQRKTPENQGGDDLDALDGSGADDGRTMEVRNANGEVLRHGDGRPFTITVLGANSKLYRDLAMKQQDRRNEMFSRTRRLASQQVMEKDTVELLVRVTRKWDIILNGQPVPSNEKNYREVYGNPKYLELRRQVDEFVGNAANFSKA